MESSRLGAYIQHGVIPSGSIEGHCMAMATLKREATRPPTHGSPLTRQSHAATPEDSFVEGLSTSGLVGVGPSLPFFEENHEHSACLFPPKVSRQLPRGSA